MFPTAYRGGPRSEQSMRALASGNIKLRAQIARRIVRASCSDGRHASGSSKANSPSVGVSSASHGSA